MSNETGGQLRFHFIFFIHNASIRKTVNTSITWKTHAHTYSDQREGSGFVAD